jgi:hypothetical protein
MRRATVFPISTMKEDNTHHSHCGATHTKSDVTNDTPVQSNCSKDKQKYTQCATYVAFEPIFWGLRIAGLFYEHRQQSTLSASACAGVSVMQVYCCITMSALVLLFLVGVGMTSALLTSLEPAVVLLFIGIMLMGECAANALSMFRACCSKKGLKKFFGAICNLEKYGGPLIPPSTTHNLVVASCVVGWAVVVFGTAFEVYIIVFTAFFEETLQSYFPLYENLNNNVIKTAYILCEAYFWTMWAWMNIFQLAVSAWLYCEFHHLRRVLSRQLTTHSGELNSDWLEVSRKRFIEMTRIVRAADECFSLRIAASFGCNIISICLLLYSIIYHPEAARQPASLPSYACWLCISVADLTLSCVSGILVIAQVSASAKCTVFTAVDSYLAFICRVVGK